MSDAHEDDRRNRWTPSIFAPGPVNASGVVVALVLLIAAFVALACLVSAWFWIGAGSCIAYTIAAVVWLVRRLRVRA